mmetsp:Transcript_24498/g.68756  ORF Transcript_24498/g.68756 Transcript_24498/m.68756 type:complete len:1123 (-) Transcript_24498:191-3559(-)|eukprot:CAMPEP_0119550122 /NCGR_PEP_ID=MMETSP1352-20130426/3707_1 /TAXON_ID=265584 /ORGANISM="Stauroneis constricta, Strain CCMP1120" /LENGTH=1122 /DNA_ID=CAMNT_0007595879 /DNA_START=182 /DNA_END=3550 /DNA_ORIENTATION=-
MGRATAAAKETTTNHTTSTNTAGITGITTNSSTDIDASKAAASLFESDIYDFGFQKTSVDFALDEDWSVQPETTTATAATRTPTQFSNTESAPASARAPSSKDSGGSNSNGNPTQTQRQARSASPAEVSPWDPQDLQKQIADLGSWNSHSSTKPRRIQDLVTPALALLDLEPSRDDPNSQANHPSITAASNEDDDDGWPFQSACLFQQAKSKRRRRMTSSSGSAKDIQRSAAKAKTPTLQYRMEASRNLGEGSESSHQSPDRPRSDRSDHKDDQRKAAGNLQQQQQQTEAWKMRETWKNSGHSSSSNGGASEKREASSSSSSNNNNNNNTATSSSSSRPSRPRRGADQGPSKPRRANSIRPDAEENKNDMDKPPMKPKARHGAASRRGGRPVREMSSNSGSSSVATVSDDDDGDDDGANYDNDKSSSNNGSNEDSLDTGSFHKLVQDSDMPKSRSKERRNRSARRRPQKDAEPAQTSASDEDSEFYEEVIAVETQQPKADDDGDEGEGGAGTAALAAAAPGSGGARRKSWRERRAANRLNRDGGADDDAAEEQQNFESVEGTERLTLSGGKRSTSSRRNMRRTHSERWRNNVEGGIVADGGESIQRRARASLVQANAELSKSAHSGKRPTPRRGAGLSMGTASFHEMTSSRRRPRSRSIDSMDSGSFHDDSYDAHDSNEGSGRSRRTLDSIEDLEDFEHIDFQTPGMIDFDEELLDQMQRANPEDTAQLNRRVHRQRERLEYDQNMPMMTKQALMTRQGSTQVMRQRFDASNLDKKRILLRNDSMNSSASSADDPTRPRVRPLSGGARRAPPRTRSSGLAGLSAHDFKRQSSRHDDGPDRRQLFRTKSTNTNSFQQYMNKPNKVAQLSRRPAENLDRHSSRSGSAGGSGGSSSSLSAAKDRRRTLQRAKSATSLKRANRDGGGSKSDAAEGEDAQNKDESGKVVVSVEKEPMTKVPDATAGDNAVVKEIVKQPEQVYGDDDKKTKVSPKRPVESTKKSSSSSSSKLQQQRKLQQQQQQEPSSSSQLQEQEQKPKQAHKQRPSQMSPRKPPKRTKSVPVRPSNLSSPILRRKAAKRDMAKKSHRQILHAMMYEQKMGITMKDLHKKVKKGTKPRENPLMITAP